MQMLLVILAALSGVVLLASLAWPLAMHYRLFRRKLQRVDAIRAQPRYRKTDAFLDQAEKKTLDSLRQMVGSGLSVYPKVRLGSILRLKSGQESANPELAAYVRQQVVDFVVCDTSTQQPVLVVMLRNNTNASPQTLLARETLDDLLQTAGMPALPIARQQSHGSVQIAQSLQSALSTFMKQQADAA